jgi:DNA-binding beta-propeller fold protein YncE
MFPRTQKRIVTTNINSGTVSIMKKSAMRALSSRHQNSQRGTAQGAPPPRPTPGSQSEDWNQTIIRVGPGSEGFDVSPDAREIWTANAHDGTIAIIRFSAKNWRKLCKPTSVEPTASNSRPTASVFVSTLSGPDVVVFDAVTRKEIKRIPVGHGAAGIQMQPDNSRVFVACTPDNYVVAIDLKSLRSQPISTPALNPTAWPGPASINSGWAAPSGSTQLFTSRI